MAKKARIVDSSVTYRGNGMEAIGIKTDIKTEASDKDVIRMNNIGPMNNIKKCKEMKNSLDVKIIPK